MTERQARMITVMVDFIVYMLIALVSELAVVIFLLIVIARN